METTTVQLGDATAVLDALDPEQITERLDRLEAEKEALRVLLRAARARTRGRTQEGQGSRARATHSGEVGSQPD
jgi:hypothetical protein